MHEFSHEIKNLDQLRLRVRSKSNASIDPYRLPQYVDLLNDLHMRPNAEARIDRINPNRNDAVLSAAYEDGAVVLHKVRVDVEANRLTGRMIYEDHRSHDASTHHQWSEYLLKSTGATFPDGLHRQDDVIRACENFDDQLHARHLWHVRVAPVVLQSLDEWKLAETSIVAPADHVDHDPAATDSADCAARQYTTPVGADEPAADQPLFANPSAPMSMAEAARCCGGQVTPKKLKSMMDNNRVRFRKLGRQLFIFSRDDLPNLPAK